MFKTVGQVLFLKRDAGGLKCPLGMQRVASMSVSLIEAIFRSLESEHDVRQGLDAMVLVDEVVQVPRILEFSLYRPSVRLHPQLQPARCSICIRANGVAPTDEDVRGRLALRKV
jgi:hypothetical protein